jgi:hypothetical protein
MRIAFDLDGVLADLHARFVESATLLYPELDRRSIGSPDVGGSPGEGSGTDLVLTAQQSDAVWRHLVGIDNFWEALDEIERGAIARLAALSDERRWDVLFITSRPGSAGRTAQRQSQRWLERLGFPLPSVYVVQGSRGRIAAALDIDVVVDDRPENCLDVVLESKAGAVLVWRGEAERLPESARRLGIAVVPTVVACLDALAEAQQAGRESGFLDRLRRLLGFSARPSAMLRR